MPLRIGINFGKVLIEGAGVYGDDVNIAARVEALAGKGGICLTGAVFDRVNGKLPLGYEAYGPQRFKNIGRRVRAYRVRREPLMVGRVVPGKPPIPRSRWRAVAAAALLAVAGASAWSLYLQDEMVEWRTMAAEQAAATAAARARAQALVASLEAAETRVSAARARAAELLAGLLAAERAAAERVHSADTATRAEAERTATETERAQALRASLTEAEARAAAEQTRAEALLVALRETEVQAAAARDATTRRELAEHAAERKRAATLISSWQATETQAAAERARMEALLAALEDAERSALAEAGAAAQRAAERAETERRAAEERAKAEALVAALEAAERKAAEELRKGADLMASLEDTEGAPKRERVERLLAALQAAGQTAATERKRAELLIASWEASAGGIALSQARAEEDAAHRALEERGAERRRAEALLGLWQDAEATAASERARAEALLATLREADERAALKRAVAPRRKPEPEVQDQPQEAAAETEALTPAPLEPEDAAGAPAAPDQLAALPGQPEATDAGLSKDREDVVAPENERPSLEAVERLLRERAEAFRPVLQAYLVRNQIEKLGSRGDELMIRGLRQTEVLGAEDDTYRIRAQFYFRGNNYDDFGDIVVFLKIDGEDFEIVGHELSSDEAGEQSARAPATPEQLAAMEAVERLLRERQEEFRRKLRDYNDARQIEPVQYMLGRSFRLYEMNVLGMANGAYEVRALFAPVTGKSSTSGAVDVVVFVTIDGDDFEIVGHEIPSDERTEQAAAQATDPAEASGEFSGN